MSELPTSKGSLLAIIEILIQDIKDPKTLLLRACTILLAIISYQAVAHQDAILEGFKNFSTSSVITQQQVAREHEYPNVARKEAINILNQLEQDYVIIWDYEPKFLNNYITVLASEGTLPVQAINMDKQSVDKSSTLYVHHLQAKSYQQSFMTTEELNQKDSWEQSQLPVSYKRFTAQGQKNFFSMPIYDLSGTYAGVVLVLWKDPPKIWQTSNYYQLLTNLNSRIQSSRRALERQK